MTKPLTHNEMISAIFAGNTEAVRLEGELEKVTKERDELVENIKNGFEGGCYLCEVVGETNKRLHKERDEARQLCCRMSAQFIYLSGELCTAKFVANEKGWDCFKEETQ